MKILKRHGDTGTALAMWLTRRYTGSTLQEIGVAMGGKDYAAVGMAILRFDGRLQRDRKLQTTARRVARGRTGTHTSCVSSYARQKGWTAFELSGMMPTHRALREASRYAEVADPMN